MLGAGLYSWFAEYEQDCLITENCQDRGLQIEESYDVWIYNLATKAIVEMVSPVQAVPTYARDNVNGFLSSILAWVRGQNGEAIGQREFEGFQIYQPDWLDGLSGMTDVCLTALTAVIKCDDWMERFEEPAYRGDLNNDTLTESICDPGCGASLKSYFGTVESSCAGYVLNEARPSKIGGTIWAGYNETCLQDTATGQYCNKLILDFAEVDAVSEMPTTELCSYCFVGKLEMMQSSQYSFYDSYYKGALELVQQKCGVSGPTIFPDSLIIREPEPVPICVSENIYTTKSGDTCDSIAKASTVSSAGIFQGNSANITDCSSIEAGLNLCLPQNCNATYTLQPEDTCTIIEIATGIGFGNLRVYNPWIIYGCLNLQTASQVYGKIPCLAPIGGTFTATAPPVGVSSLPVPVTGYADAMVAPPANATVATGTTLNCGKWHGDIAGETCASICVEEGITLALFLQINPSLSTTDCTSTLVAGLTYCVGPTYDWAEPAIHITADSAVAAAFSVSQYSVA